MALPATSEMAGPDGRVLRYCLHGPADGFPTIVHGGSPSSRWKRPGQIETMENSKLRLLVYDRPGYGGSTRHPGRAVSDAAPDTAALADHLGWDRFAVFGGSGGGPHALACTALLPGRVTRCAVVSGIKPALKPLPDEAALRSDLAAHAATILAKVEAGGPEMPAEPGPPARTDPDAMARLRATFVDSMDGWVDDSLAFRREWGFDPAGITVTVGIWRGTADPTVSADNSEWLLANIPGSQGYVYAGGHLPGPDTYGEIYEWLV